MTQADVAERDTQEPVHAVRHGQVYCPAEWASTGETYMGGVAIRCPHGDEPLRYERRVEADPEPETQQVQAEAEGVRAPAEIEFMGERFKLADNIPIGPLMRFALDTQDAGLDTNDMPALASMYKVIRSCVHRPVLMEPDMLPVEGTDELIPNPKVGQKMRDPDTGRVMRDEREWKRFEALAEDEDATIEDYNDFMGKAMEAIAARPQTRRGNSSATSPATSEKSRGTSSLPGIPADVAGLVPVADLARSTG